MPTTYNYNLQADQMVRRAVQLCGVLGLGKAIKPEFVQDGRDMLTEILKSLQAEGYTLTQLVRATVAIQAGVSSYALPASFIDVEAEATTLTQPNSPTETYVDRMAYEDWRLISDKTITGLPTRVFVEKTTSLTAFFWSVPDQSYTWNYRGVQLLPDMGDGATTPGLTQRWMAALTTRLAYLMSYPLNVPSTRRMELKIESAALKKIAMEQEAEHVDVQFMLPRDPWGSY